MITRTYIKGDAVSSATYSDCERYRYNLIRSWDNDKSRILFIMLNPSTATEKQNDPSVERCERRARFLNYGSFSVANIFAYRATNPQDIRKISNPIGINNDAEIMRNLTHADTIVCAWGVHGRFLNRGKEVATLLRATNKPLFHLGLTRNHHPKHPLYISYAQNLMIWD